MALRIIYAGTPSFAVPALDALAVRADVEIVAVYTQPDRPAGRGQRLTPSPVKERALALGLPVRQPETLKAAEAQAELAQCAADLMVVAAYGLILPQAVLDAPCLGCVNIHASLLPRWRGAAPIARAIEAGDAQTGITIMKMAAGLDTGDMLLTRSMPIQPDDTAASLHDRLAVQGAEALCAALPGIRDGSLVGVPQDDALATYAAKLTKAEARIDWRESAALIVRRVRAFNPAPVAFMQWQGEPIKVWQAEEADARPGARPGTVVAVDKRGFVVATAEGGVRVLVCQKAGGKRIAAADFARQGEWLGVQFD
ncbi:methionyl-tRNA formyltransferase [Halothiobacillus sp. DCM-1]|uniref:methionyl-tRNA formyltransferase n=1 Tax=Halothiobacillus sp. DCM-1 TaxID=3112558 RepID=UPI003246F9AE